MLQDLVTVARNGTGSASLDNVEVMSYVLAGCCIVVGILDVVLLVRLLIIAKETRLKYNGKKLFHVVIAISLFGRAAFFFMWTLRDQIPSFPSALFAWFNHSLELVFFLAFFLLLVFWVDLIATLRNSVNVFPLSLRVALGIVLSIVVGAFAVFLGLILTYQSNVSELLFLDALYAGLVDVLSVATAIAFLVFGVILYRLLRQQNQLLTVHAEKKKSMAKNVFVVTILCTLCFLFRVGTSVYSISLEWNGSGEQNFDVPSWVFFMYYFLPEILGTSLMLFLLRIPRRESSNRMTSLNAGYRPIV